MVSGICKPLKSYSSVSRPVLPYPSPQKSPSLVLHGNIQYDYLYRSITDTPFYQKDFRQHTVSTNLRFLVRNNFILRATVLHRNSNSPYFRDITTVSVQFNQRDYLQHLKEQLTLGAIPSIHQFYKKDIDEANIRYRRKLAEVEELKRWLSSPARINDIIAENERWLPGLPAMAKEQVPVNIPAAITLPDESLLKNAILEKANGKLSAFGDSVLQVADRWMAIQKQKAVDSLRKTQTAAYISEKKKKLDSLQKDLAGYETTLQQTQKKLADSLAQFKQEISKLTSMPQLQRYAQNKKSSLQGLSKNWKTLAAIRNIGIGRTWLDYSEMTVKNISVTGVNAEINPGNVYLAFAAGGINYRFRDFVVQDKNQIDKGQSIYIIRAGVGKKESTNFIITWYDGKRYVLASTGSQNNNPGALQRVNGMAAETRLALNENQYIIGEFAKSSFASTDSTGGSSGSSLSKVGNFKDRRNEGYGIRIYSFWPSAGSKLSGYYRKSGELFQSFNLQPLNSRQEAFQLKWQQNLWRKRIMVEAAIRKNDFTNPFLVQRTSSRAVFKSLQASLRIPKYPFISIGYAPTTQLIVLDDQRLAESQYNTLNAVLSYSYKAGKLQMSSNAMLLKFYNNVQDTGFLYYNASSITLNQFFYFNRLQLQSGITITDQQPLRVFTYEQDIIWQAGSKLSLNGGIKYNKVNSRDVCWGGTVGVLLTLPGIGVLQAGYEKSYLPGTNRNLLPAETGRLSFSKVF